MRKKKIAIVGVSALSQQAGKFDKLLACLIENLSEEFEIHLYASRREKTVNERNLASSKLHYLNAKSRGGNGILFAYWSILHAMFTSRIIIVLGPHAGLMIPIARKIGRAKIILNTGGLNRKGKNSKGSWRFKFLAFSERVGIKYSHADIADNKVLKRFNAMHFGTISHLITYGAEHVEYTDFSSLDAENYAFVDHKYGLVICDSQRSHKMNLVLRNYLSMPDKHLVIVGDWFKMELDPNLRSRAESSSNIFILGEVSDEKDRFKLMGNCSFYLHTSDHAGTDLNLVEVMYMRKPVVAYNSAFNRATTGGLAYYFSSSEQLTNILNDLNWVEMLDMKKELKKIAESRYDWSLIGLKYANVIRAFDWNYKKGSSKDSVTQLGYNELLEEGYAHLQMSPQISDQ